MEKPREKFPFNRVRRRAPRCAGVVQRRPTASLVVTPSLPGYCHRRIQRRSDLSLLGARNRRGCDKRLERS